MKLILITGDDIYMKKIFSKKISVDMPEDDFVSTYYQGSFVLIDNRQNFDHFSVIDKICPNQLFIFSSNIQNFKKLDLNYNKVFLYLSSSAFRSDKFICLNNVNDIMNAFFECIEDNKADERKSLESLKNSLEEEEGKELHKIKSFVPKFRSIFIMGRSNSGKSSMFNELIDLNIARIEDKYQTTQSKIEYPLQSKNITLIDSIGVLKSVKMTVKWKKMIRIAQSSDMVCVVISVDHFYEKINFVALEWAKNNNKPFFIVINKIDLVSKEVLNEMVDFLKLKSGVENIDIIFRRNDVQCGWLQKFFDTIDYCKSLFNKRYTFQSLRTLSEKVEVLGINSSTKSGVPTFFVFVKKLLKINELKRVQKHIIKFFGIRNLFPKTINTLRVINKKKR